MKNRMNINDNILAGLRKGNESALKQLYDLYFHPLCVFGSRYVREDAAVADMVQEVFIKVWERRKQFDAIYSLRSFMYVAVHNACLNYNREATRVVRISLADDLLENYADEECCLVIEEEVHQQIQREIERLPAAMKRVFKLTLQDMSIPEIAQVLKVSENTVRNQRARARDILRDRLKDKFLLFFIPFL